jgi:hypothetical protein
VLDLMTEACGISGAAMRPIKELLERMLVGEVRRDTLSCSSSELLPLYIVLERTGLHSG